VLPEWGRVLEIAPHPPSVDPSGYFKPRNCCGYIIKESKYPVLGVLIFLIAPVVRLEIPGWIHGGGEIYIYIWLSKKIKYPVIIYVTMVLKSF
jgi:hypothetical protein